MAVVRSGPTLSTSTPCGSTHVPCVLYMQHTYIHEWSYDVTHEGEWGRREWLALVLGQNSIASWPAGTVTASVSNIWRYVHVFLPALFWSLECAIRVRKDPMNVNLDIIIWFFVCYFITFKPTTVDSSHIPSSKSLTIVLLRVLSAAYSNPFITSSPSYTAGHVCFRCPYQKSVAKMLKKK